MQTEMDDETDDDDDGNGRTSNDDSFSSLEWDDFEGQILGDTRMLRDGDTAEKKLDETVVFDDFGSSFLVGDCDSSNSNRRTVGLSSSSSLADRIQRVQSQQVRQDAITSRNWKLGHWQVRGFSFDDNDDESIHEPVEYAVTRIVQATPTDTDDETMTRDLVWVGRSDGCVFGIRLGTDYLTKLPEGRGPSKSVKSYNEIRSDKEMMDDDDDDENDEYEQRSDLTATTRPFEVVVRLQRQHSDEDRVAGRIPIGPVDALAVMESTDVGSETIVNVFTASSDSPGTIQKWELVWGSIVNNYKNHENDVPATSSSMLCPPICSSVHSNSPIRYLQTLQLKSNTRSKNTEQNDCRKILLSADSYKFAVWDAQNGVLLKKCRVNESLPAFAEASLSTTTANKKNVVDDPIICSVHANGSHVYVGTMTGQVLVYSIADILSSSVEICPAGQWRASQGPVTSVACGGLGSLGRNRPDAAPTTVIYTGDSQGLVKQWEIFSGGHKMEAWPKLATQRLPKKAHLFSGHDGNVTAIMAVDAVKFVTGATDGTGT